MLWYLPAVLTLLATIPNLRHTIGWQTGTASMNPKTIFIGFGSVVVAWGPGKWAKPGSWTMGSFVEDGFTIWHFRTSMSAWLQPRFLGDQIYIPLWLIAIMLAIPPGFMECRRRTRRAPGSCRKCGYDRASLPADTKCPECGDTRVRN